jgi:hypothetical protein
MQKEEGIMKSLTSSVSKLALALLSFPSAAVAAEHGAGWSLNFTPVVVLPEHGHDVGGGLDPEVKYTFELGEARLSTGARVGGYYAKDLFGVMAMPTLRLTVPIGSFEPYASFGAGYGRIAQDGHQDVATMSRVGFVYHFSERLALGIEGTFQEIEGSPFRFPSFGSMMAFDL